MPLELIRKKLRCIVFFYSVWNPLFAQQPDSLVQRFWVTGELRPRAEYRDNYILPPNDTIVPDLYITQRNRISIGYERKSWQIKCAVQEIHVWKDEHTVSDVGSVNVYQLFLESKFKSINVRIGRQSVLFDNGRLFSDAPWAQQSRSHEGLRVMKYSKHVSNDLLFLFTRKYDTTFDALYSPVASNRYNYLLIYHLSYKSDKWFSFNSIDAVDFFEHTKTGDLYARATLGGRMEIKNKQWYYTVNGFVQFGAYPQGKNVLAYYIQPEIKLSVKKIHFDWVQKYLVGAVHSSIQRIQAILMYCMV